MGWTVRGLFPYLIAGLTSLFLACVASLQLLLNLVLAASLYGLGLCLPADIRPLLLAALPHPLLTASLTRTPAYLAGSRKFGYGLPGFGESLEHGIDSSEVVEGAVSGENDSGHVVGDGRGGGDCQLEFQKLVDSLFDAGRQSCDLREEIGEIAHHFFGLVTHNLTKYR